MIGFAQRDAFLTTYCMHANLLNHARSIPRIAQMAVLALCGAIPFTHGQGELPYRPNRIYDQSPIGENPSLLPWMSSVEIASSFLPLGQVFVPQEGTLGFVELIVHYPHPKWRPERHSQTVAVRVHAGDTLEGPLVGSSEAVSFDRTIDPQSPGFIEFPFPEPVSLLPGMPYTLEVAYLAGDEILGLSMIPGGGGDTYPPGWMYLAGYPPPGTSWHGDLWFRTGTIIPEPSPAALLLIGGAMLLVGQRRRRNKTGAQSYPAP